MRASGHRSFLPLALLGCMFSHEGHADTCTATDNGDWAAAGTWSCGHAPAAGDIMVIPAGITVSVTSNIAYTGAAMRVRVSGTLFFDGGGSKLSFPCGSIVEIMSSSASISGNNSGNSQSIKICGTTFWQVSNGTQTGYLAWPPNSTLPVELIGFTGEGKGGTAELRWATATEFNSERFELWREQAEGAVLLGPVPASGTTQEMHSYLLRDVPPAAGTWIYTLVQYDLDGRSETLGTVAVRTERDEELQCFPVPAAEVLAIGVRNVPSVVVISDANGLVVLRRTLLANLTELPIAQLPNGVYMAATTDAGGTRMKRFVVMR